MAKKKIGIVTFEFPGLTKNGGIGTAYGRLADLLHEAGHEVSVFFVCIEESNSKLVSEVQKNAKAVSKKKKYPISIILTKSEWHYGNVWGVARAAAVHDTLKDRHFDILHFHDGLGLGTLVLKNKHLGLGFQNTEIVVGLHGSSGWHWEGQRFFFSSPPEYIQGTMEREQVEWADTVVSPSRYMVDYYKGLKWKVDSDAEIIPNCNRFGSSAVLKKGLVRSRPVSRLVFFGRLEPRKGLIVFLNALKIIAMGIRRKGAQKTKLPVTFLGRDTESENGFSGLRLIQEAASELSDVFHFKAHTHFSQPDCEAFFQKHPDSLICMPSLLDNSPYAVVEALEQGLNFISSNHGGQKELIDSDYAKDATCAPEPWELAKKIVFRMTVPSPVPRPALSVLEANRMWLDFHLDRKARSVKKPASLRKAVPFSVVITVGFDLGSLEDTLKSVTRKRGPKEIVVVRYGYLRRDQEKAFEEIRTAYSRKVRFHHGEEASPWDAYRFALSKVSVKKVLILRPGDELSPDGFEIIQKCLSRSEKKVTLFGYARGKVSFLPPPMELNYLSYCPSIENFPVLLDKNAVSKSMVSHESHQIGAQNEMALRGLFKKDEIEMVPQVILGSESRSAFSPYATANSETIFSRFEMLRNHMPIEHVKNMELAAGLLLGTSR
ncbi:MAG: glycosyltransferase family 4 protein [Bdellovibrionales bacterium]|nr:glycosyltransferase family 4 protein [Bdellovibrionales bacterium]